MHELLQQPKQLVSEELSVDNFADYFRSKVATIRVSTASAAPPDIRPRLVPPLTSFEPVTEEEISRLKVVVQPTSQVLLIRSSANVVSETTHCTYGSCYLPPM